MDVTLQPEVEKMVLDHVRSGEYSSTSELVNAAVRNFLEDECVAAQKPDLKSLELAQDAPANLEWLNRNRAAYVGEWVALYKGRLVAHGKNGLDVFLAAQSQGINPPLMHRIVQEDPVSWGGWQAGAEAQFSNRVSIQRRTRNSPSSGVALRRP